MNKSNKRKAKSGAQNLPKRQNFKLPPSSSDSNEKEQMEKAMSINKHQSVSVTRVADAGLFATHIFPMVLERKDKRNCMLVCKQWYSQMRTSSAWRHVRRIMLRNHGSNHPVLRIPCGTSVSLGILSSPLSPAIVPDEHVLSFLRLCTNVRTIDWDDQMMCGGVDVLIGWLDEGKVMWPKLSFIKCLFWTTDLHHNLAKLDYLLSTTLKQVQTIGMDFLRNYKLPPTEEQRQQYERDCMNALATLLSHHVHKLHELRLGVELHDRLYTAVLSSVLHAQPTAINVLHVRVFSDEVRQMLIDLINLQRGGTLTKLNIDHFKDNRADKWLAFINAIDRCAVQNLQTLYASGVDDNELPDVCALLSDKCEKLRRLTIPGVISLTLTELTTIVQHFTNARDNFTFESKAGHIGGDQQRRNYSRLPADELATALRIQFDVLQFDGNVEKTDNVFRFTVNNCEFVFGQWF